MRPRPLRRLALLAAIPLLLAASKCNRVASIDVKVQTRVYEDGPIDRTVTIAERPGPEALPLTDEGITVPAPERWQRLEATGTTAVAEGSFARPQDVPPLVEHALDDGTVHADRHDLELEVTDLVVARVFHYKETEADPLGPDQVAAAYDKALDLMMPAARGALQARVGPDLDTSRMEAFLRGPFKGGIVDTMASYDNLEKASDLPSRARALFAKHGLTIPAAPKKDDGTDDVDAWTNDFVSWVGTRLAATLSTPKRTVPADATAFLFDDAAYDPEGEMGRRLPVPPEGHATWEQVLAPLADAASGIYASRHDSVLSGKLLFLFQSRLELPGRLLTTNGTIDGREVLWVFGDREITRSGRVMEARSAVVLGEPLRRLGVSPDLDLVHLVRIVYLLTADDAAEHTLARLKDAVAQRKPELLYTPESSDPDEPTLGDTQCFELARLLGVPEPKAKAAPAR
jgi:hypothetical protein